MYHKQNFEKIELLDVNELRCDKNESKFSSQIIYKLKKSNTA